MASYQTIAEPLHVPAETINGSRFITDIYPASSDAQALAAVQRIREQYPDASHHCWAYRLHHQNQIRSSDDGEPGGSAGRPILAQIAGHDLFDIVIVVTRYFGGTKLGVGGLIRAYGGSAGRALDQVKTAEIHETAALEIEFSYDLTKAVDAVLRQYQLAPMNTGFDDRVRMKIHVPIESINELKQALVQQTSGRIQCTSQRESGKA